MKLKIAPAVCVLSLGELAVTPCFAEQAGSGHYNPGQTASFIDELPGRPGWAAMNMFLYYDGNFGGGRILPLGGAFAVNVDATVHADILVLLYESQYGILGGNFAFAAAVPEVWMTVRVDATFTGPGGTQLSAGKKESVSGIGDVLLYPFMLGWTNGTDFKYDVRLGIYTPTGEYERGSVANVGKNYWTFEPEVTFSWLSSKIGTEFSAFVGTDFNTENNDGDYQTGNQFHFDGTLAQHLPLFHGFVGLGANGYYYKQFTGDSGSGARLGGFMAKTTGVGPVISYATKVGGHSILIAELKWLHEVEVTNRTEGDFVWFKLALIF